MLGLMQLDHGADNKAVLLQFRFLYSKRTSPQNISV